MIHPLVLGDGPAAVRRRRHVAALTLVKSVPDDDGRDHRDVPPAGARRSPAEGAVPTDTSAPRAARRRDA